MKNLLYTTSIICFMDGFYGLILFGETYMYGCIPHDVFCFVTGFSLLIAGIVFEVKEYKSKRR